MGLTISFTKSKKIIYQIHVVNVFHVSIELTKGKWF